MRLLLVAPSVIIHFVVSFLVCLSLLTCKPASTTPEESDSAETVYVTNTEGNLFAIDANTGNANWGFRLDNHSLSGPTYVYRGFL
ncbi:PQQ-binding-like beta-propeller repeat protein [Spirosoma aureum]|uniref:PQQ-binding-like beta-propeller repeat protein n=1 Tax=Spirosoma aureum TaxID=2692134 RepID=A0A6G9AQS0_9BACT|nr:PQQ-binding-like beta-propeller repeat protein [Spirosoma aureum]